MTRVFGLIQALPTATGTHEASVGGMQVLPEGPSADEVLCAESAAKREPFQRLLLAVPTQVPSRPRPAKLSLSRRTIYVHQLPWCCFLSFLVGAFSRLRKKPDYYSG